MGFFTPNDGYSRESFAGVRENFDKDGNKVGYSQPRIDGGRDYFDNDGKWLGCARPSFGGNMEFIDNTGKMVGYSHNYGDINRYYDMDRKFVGHSTSGFGVTEFYDNSDYTHEREHDFDSFDDFSETDYTVTRPQYVPPPREKTPKELAAEEARTDKIVQIVQKGMILALVILMGVLCINIFMSHRELKQVRVLEAYALEQFMEKTAPQLAKDIAEELSVRNVRLEAEIESLYDEYHSYYNAKHKKLTTACRVKIIILDKSYWEPATKPLRKALSPADKLYNLWKEERYRDWQHRTYHYSGPDGTVDLQVLTLNNKDSITVYSEDGHSYTVTVGKDRDYYKYQ